MKIGELAAKTGLSAHTIRYYERIGLLPFAIRDASGHRSYDASILKWVDFLSRLKATGMPIRDMQLYARLHEEGQSTNDQRQRLLIEHRIRVRSHMAELQASLLVLDEKIDGYNRQS